MKILTSIILAFFSRRFVTDDLLVWRSLSDLLRPSLRYQRTLDCLSHRGPRRGQGKIHSVKQTHHHHHHHISYSHCGVCLCQLDMGKRFYTMIDLFRRIVEIGLFNDLFCFRTSRDLIAEQISAM